ncbi:MAG TPA: CHAT domain-containing protein [Thermoanaerobaculia bacterium]|nr:CHAT domain-containing protein [Thermoanaerobaculia bacterium]
MNGLPRHPSDGTLAAFLDGRLAPDEIAYVADHLRGCADCRTVVSETARFEREEERVPTTHAANPWKLRIAAMLAAIAISVPMLLRYVQSDARLIPRMVAAAPKDHRILEPRLSGFSWARFRAPTRGKPLVDAAEMRLNGAAGDVLQRTEDRTTPEAAHARGVALLVAGRADDGIAALEQAARKSQDARAWNDLAAARYQMAVEEKCNAELPQAFANIERALQLDPKSAEVLFNRALILEQLGLRDQARKAWERYLEVDPGSGWSTEARERLQRLTNNTKRFNPKLFESSTPDDMARQFPEETRTYGEVVFLGDWGNAVAARDDKASAASLSLVHALGEALQRANGEQMLADAAASIERGDDAARATLADGHRTYYTGRVALTQKKLGEAEPLLRRAALLFDRGGSPMSQVARYYAAIAAFGQGRAEEAHAEFVRLLATIDQIRHRALAAQIHWQLAVLANGAGDWGTGARHADAGATIFGDLRESSNAVMLDGIAAMSLEMIGDRDHAWERRQRTFSGSTNAGQVGAILHSSAWTMASLGQNDAAASFLDLKIDGADRTDAAALSASYAEVIRLAGRSGDTLRAERAFNSARAYAARVTDPALRSIANAEIDLAGAWRAGDSRSSIAAIDRAIAHFTAIGRYAVLPDAYAQRARAHRIAGDDDAAASDLEAGLREVEKQRSSISPEEQPKFLDVAAQLIEDTIELRLSRNDVTGALDIADWSRSLLDTIPLDAQTNVRPPLAPGVALVEYVVFPRRVVAFCVTAGSVTAHPIPIDRAELGAVIASFADAIRRNAPLPRIEAGAEAMHRLLIAPLGQRLAGIRELVIVPDRQLYAVPFAALRNPVTKRYLVEEMTIRFAPSATFRREAADTLEPALVVVDPPTPEWPPLSASRDEGKRIASMHGATLLEGEKATRAAFVDAAQRSSLIHFAGHANSNAGTSYGALLLAASGADNGMVGSSDIARLRLGRQPLVILAACGTFRADPLHVSGMASLARAFLTAGARGVVGTLWEINDDVSAELFLRLHRYLLEGNAPAEALRRAQTDLLHSGNPHLAQPGSWAAVEFLGNV